MTYKDFCLKIGWDLRRELEITDANFNKTILMAKVEGAVREVLQELGYSPFINNMENEMPSEIMKYYSNVRAISLYDYNMVGGDFTTSISENNTSRHFVNRDSLFAGIIPLARFGKNKMVGDIITIPDRNDDDSNNNSNDCNCECDTSDINMKDLLIDYPNEW